MSSDRHTQLSANSSTLDPVSEAGASEHRVFSRRSFLKGLLCSAPALVGASSMLGLLGCERHRYIRPAGELLLGSVRELLYSVVHVRSKAILVYRDVDGWRALSTRCTYQGCDLTYQEENLFCPCCRSYFDHEGNLIPGGKAEHPLPWVTMFYKDGSLYANPGKIVPPTYRFSTPEIEEAVRKLRERIKEEGLADEVKIPKILTGAGDGEPGTMFIEEDPNLVHELQMIK